MTRKFWKGIIIGLLLIFGQNTFAATTELGLGDTFKYSLISVGDILKVPEGATGCTIHDDSIRGTLDLDEQVGADTLGAEELTDPGFDDAGEWNDAAPNITHDDVAGTVTWAGTGAIISIDAAGTFTVGKLYKTVIEIDSMTTGILRFFSGAYAFQGTPDNWTSAGTKTIYRFCTNDLAFALYGDATCNAVISNVSIKEVTSTTGIYNTWITTVDLAGIGLEEVALFRNCAFVESEATITATLPTATLEDETGATEMRGSFVDGQAWFHDAGGLIDAFADTGDLIIVNDGSGNLAQGYLGEVGTGEALAAEALDDPGLTNAAEWSDVDANVTHNAGAGTVTWDGLGEGNFETVDGAGQFTLGKLYKIVVVIDSITAGSIRIGAGVWAFQGTHVSWTTPGTKTIYKTCTDDLGFGLYGDATCDAVISNISIKEVTEPAATAVHIYQEHALTNEGWYSITSGIDYNAGASWDFDIYNYGTVWFDDECQFSIVTADCFRDYASADYHLTAGSPLKDAGEAYLNITNLDTSDWTGAGTDDYAGTRLHTFTGDHDAVSDGVTSKDDCLMLAADNVNGSHNTTITKANNGMSDQGDFKLTYSFYVPAAQTHADGLKIQFHNGTDYTILATHASSSGNWVTNAVYWSAAEATTMTLYFQMMDGAVTSFIGDNDGAGDLLYLHNVVIGYDAGDIDLEGRVTPIGAGYDIGAYELRLSGGSMGMGMGLNSYCPYRDDN